MEKIISFNSLNLKFLTFKNNNYVDERFGESNIRGKIKHF